MLSHQGEIKKIEKVNPLKTLSIRIPEKDEKYIPEVVVSPNGRLFLIYRKKAGIFWNSSDLM